jgi:integrase
MHNSGWKRAWQRAGLPSGKEYNKGPHNLKHTFSRRLRNAGVPLETRKVLLHHVVGDVTVHYSPAEIRELIDAVERLCGKEKTTILKAVG